MWQRNDTGHVQDVAAFPTDEHPGWRPFTVGPGEVVDFPDLLAGFTETEAPPGSADTEPQESATTAKTTRRRAAQASADPEGDETQ